MLVVGLGNPGTKYERNRHNIGFLALDNIARRADATPWAKKFGGLLCEAQGAHQKARVFLFKPQTYMNLSGEAVLAAAQFYKIAPDNIFVLHDDLDLLPGKLRVKIGGGHGGHNGLRSIDAHMGKNYWRARIGIGHPGDKDRVADYVLSNFSKEEWPLQEKMVDAITAHFPLFLERDAAGFMNKVALDVKDEG
jgi:PTH1 family peptidyl-tRNA hydrolase